MTPFRRSFSGAPWEEKAAYCRAVRAGNIIRISGTAPVTDDGSVFAPDDPYQQARRCLEIIGDHLERLDASLADVVRTRMYVTDISKWESFARAHREFFSGHPPATTMVEVRALIDPAMMIEVEAEAVVVP